MNILAKKLDLRREELGLTRDQVRTLAGVGPAQVTAVFNGQWDGIRWSTMLKVAKALGWTEQDLMSQTFVGLLQKPNEETDAERLSRRLSPHTPSVVVPIYGMASAGLGEVNESLRETPIDGVPLPFWIGILPGRILAVRVRGASMEPLIQHYDTVVGWFGEQQFVRACAKQGSVFIVTDQFNEEFVKSVFWNDEEERVTLKSFNEAYGPISMAYDSIKYMGLVVATLRSQEHFFRTSTDDWDEVDEVDGT